MGFVKKPILFLYQMSCGTCDMLDERIGRLQDIARSRETALEACRKTSQDCSSYEEDAGKVHLAASDAVIAINHHMKANHSEEEKEFLRIN